MILQILLLISIFLIIVFYRRIESAVINLRNLFWNYPDEVFFSPNSLTAQSFSFYNRLRPFSHFIFSITIIFLIYTLFLRDLNIIVKADSSTLIEGVIVGIDEEGNKNSIQKVNPLVVSSIQIEKDLNELIYESLVSVNANGEVVYELAEAIAANDKGDNYRVKLKEGIKWHDGSELTVKDVEATFNTLERLDNNSTTQSIFSRVANKRIKFVKLEGDDYRFEFQLAGIIPNFYELISFKILPAKYLEEVNTRNILTSEPYINRIPIGTGEYKFESATTDSISLIKNNDYHRRDNIPQISKIKFKFYLDEDSLVDALRSGQIHAAAGLSTNALFKLKPESNIQIHKTGIIYNQYYVLYFNLKENGPPLFKDQKMRQAISSAINRESIINILDREASEAIGPISENSFAFSQVTRYRYNLETAKKLLDELGWIQTPGEEYRKKNGAILEFNMVALDNIDRNKVSDLIIEDLKKVGIKLTVTRKTNSELSTQHVLPRNFDTLLYSMTTFTDPDRYELFHSQEITHPGLNLSSYISNEKTVKVDENKKVVTVPEVDYRLERGRSILNQEERKKEYLEFQRIVGEEVPMVFLYHPILNYAVNKRIKAIDLSKTYNLQERFKYIYTWYLEVDNNNLF